MPTATTKVYNVTYEIMDTAAKIDPIRTALLNLDQGWIVDTHAWRDDQEVNHITMTCEKPGTTIRVQIEIGTGRVLVYDNGQLLDFSVAEALARYNV